jgi:hypothetical protein
MQPQPLAAEARPFVPLCPNCRAPMRIRTIAVLDRCEEVTLACTACSAETRQSYKLGN